MTDGFFFGLRKRPFIIAEMSGNHNQSLDRALEIVDAVAATGAHALKLQTYTADTMTLKVDKPDFRINDSKSLWNGRHLHDLYHEAHTPWEWHKPIFDRCRHHGLYCFSTPFDDTAVEFLESLDQPFYKVASFELTDIPLIRKIASTRKPVIMSCGMATVGEIDEAVSTARTHGAASIALLKCTSTYPASPENTNILTIPHMKALFGTEVGLSDHTMGVGVSVAAVALGATVIEKHFTLRRADGGVDSAFSLEPEEMKSLVVETERAAAALGKVTYGATKAEKDSLQFRRSLYVAKPIRAGERLTLANTRIVRPGFGLPPRDVDRVLGMVARKDLEPGTALKWDVLAPSEGE
jgi:pseudaminic acid synthase